MYIYTLVTVSDGTDVVVTLHQDEADAFECLRENFLSEDIDPGASKDDVIGAMVDYCPDVIWAVEAHDFDSGWGV